MYITNLMAIFADSDPAPWHLQLSYTTWRRRSFFCIFLKRRVCQNLSQQTRDGKCW